MRGLLQDPWSEEGALASMQDEGRHVPRNTFLRQPQIGAQPGAALRGSEPRAPAARATNAGCSLRAWLARRNSGAVALVAWRRLMIPAVGRLSINLTGRAAARGKEVLM